MSTVKDVHKLVRVWREPRSGDAPYGWMCDSYTVMIGDITIHTFPDKASASKLASKLVKRINRFLENGEA